MTAHLIQTADGAFRACFSAQGLAQLDFPDQERSPRPALEGDPDVTAQLKDWAAMTEEAVRAVLSGQIPRAFPPMDISSGTEFQQRVWRAISSIRKGDTLSYGEIAERLGTPRAVRAVGGACGANPIPLLIPCHRVLAKGQRLGGFSGGLYWKKLLLERENPDLLAGIEEKSKSAFAVASFQTRI